VRKDKDGFYLESVIHLEYGVPKELTPRLNALAGTEHDPFLNVLEMLKKAIGTKEVRPIGFTIND